MIAGIKWSCPRGLLASLFAGNATAKVLDHLTTPSALVPPSFEGEPRFDRILVVTRGGMTASLPEPLREYAARAQVRVVDADRDSEGDHETHLRDAAAGLEGGNVTSVSLEGDPPQGDRRLRTGGEHRPCGRALPDGPGESGR